MIIKRTTLSAAALSFGLGLLGFGAVSADAGPRIWSADRSHHSVKGTVKIFTAPRPRANKVPKISDLDAVTFDSDEETVKTFTVTTVRPSRRSFRRKRALGQRYLGFKKQYTGQRFTGFKKTYRVRRNVVEVSKGKVVKGKDAVVISRTLVMPRARGVRDFKPSPSVTIIRYE
ncbi:MAG: hypothetical protein AAGI06_09710 [Pseudomonadota bacterium]